MSSSGNVIHLENDSFNIEPTQDTITVTARVVNESSITDYPVTISMSVSAGSSLVTSEDLNTRIGPNNTREYQFNVDHALPPGQDLLVCVNTEIDDENIGGL